MSVQQKMFTVRTYCRRWIWNKPERQRGLDNSKQLVLVVIPVFSVYSDNIPNCVMLCFRWYTQWWYFCWYERNAWCWWSKWSMGFLSNECGEEGCFCNCPVSNLGGFIVLQSFTVNLWTTAMLNEYATMKNCNNHFVNNDLDLLH